MSIRIPPKSDIDTQNAFRDIEQRLRALENRKPESRTPSTEIATIQADIERMKADPDKYEELRETTFVGPVNFSGDTGFSGNVYPGFLTTAPSGIGSSDQKTMNLHGSLAIAPGGISSDSVLCRRLVAYGNTDIAHDAACFKGDSSSSGQVVWDTVSFNNNTTTFTVESSTQIHVNRIGYYLINAAITLTLTAGQVSNVSLVRNNSITEAVTVISNEHASASKSITGYVSINVSATGTDYWDLRRDTGSIVASDAYNHFSIQRIN